MLSADAASAFGLRPFFVVCDELAVWPNTRNATDLWAAIVSAMPKLRGSASFVVFERRAGDAASWPHKVLKGTRDSDQWRVSELPGPCEWIAPEALEEQRRLLTGSQYARFHLNQWTAPEDRLVDPEDLAACVTLTGPQEAASGRRYVIGVDLGLRHDRTAIAVCHAEDVEDSSSRHVVLDRLHVLAGTRTREVSLADVEAAIVEASGAYGRAPVRLDPWQGIGLAQRLRARGVAVEEVTFSQAMVGRLASTLHLLLRDRLLALPDDEALLDELGSVRLRETAPGVVGVDHDPGRHDDRAIALALAATALVEQPGTTTVRLFNPARHRIPTGAGPRTTTGTRRLLDGTTSTGPLAANRATAVRFDRDTFDREVDRRLDRLGHLLGVGQVSSVRRASLRPGERAWSISLTNGRVLVLAANDPKQLQRVLIAAGRPATVGDGWMARSSPRPGKTCWRSRTSWHSNGRRHDDPDGDVPRPARHRRASPDRCGEPAADMRPRRRWRGGRGRCVRSSPTARVAVRPVLV